MSERHGISWHCRPCEASIRLFYYPKGVGKKGKQLASKTLKYFMELHGDCGDDLDKREDDGNAGLREHSDTKAKEVATKGRSGRV